MHARRKRKDLRVNLAMKISAVVTRQRGSLRRWHQWRRSQVKSGDKYWEDWRGGVWGGAVPSPVGGLGACPQKKNQFCAKKIMQFWARFGTSFLYYSTQDGLSWHYKRESERERLFTTCKHINNIQYRPTMFICSGGLPEEPEPIKAGHPLLQTT